MQEDVLDVGWLCKRRSQIIWLDHLILKSQIVSPGTATEDAKVNSHQSSLAIVSIITSIILTVVMKGTLKQGGILALVFILGLQINHILSQYLGYTEFVQKVTSLISTIFAIFFIISLVIVYRIVHVSKQRTRFSNHKIINNREYERMRISKTRSEVDKLKSSDAYQRYLEEMKVKPGLSHAKTHASIRTQEEDNLPTED